MPTSRRSLLQHLARLLTAPAVSPLEVLSSRFGSRLALPHAPGMPHAPTVAPQKDAGRPWLQPDRLTRFVDRLPIPPVLRPREARPDPRNPSGQVKYLRVAMRESSVQVHRDLPPSSMWAYNGSVPGPTIEVRNGEGLWIDWANELPAQHFLPIDHTLCGAGANLPQVRTAVHVHGARVAPESDGFPEDWKKPGEVYKAFYPLHQEAATLWYHDHAMGLERLNQYAGLFGFFLVRDGSEEELSLPAGEFEIPLVLCDRLFYADGQLHYPDSGDSAAPWVSEVYGDVVMANGKLFPYVAVEPRAYRVRLLNASNTRLFRLSLAPGMHWTQIGSDQGLLPAPAELKDLTLACAERVDVILDFREMAGQRVALINQSQPVLEFRVAGRPVTAGSVGGPAAGDLHFSVPRQLRTIERIPESAAQVTRSLTLNEYMNLKTRVMLMLLNGKYWHDPVTEKPRLDSIEVWNLINTTQDLHPIHLHLVRFQLLERRAFDVDDFLNYGKFHYVGDPAPPEPGETGWKDTIPAHPETVTRIIIPFAGYPGRYVWHCHLLEHAANEMMRPFEVLPA